MQVQIRVTYHYRDKYKRFWLVELLCPWQYGAEYVEIGHFYDQQERDEFLQKFKKGLAEAEVVYEQTRY